MVILSFHHDIAKKQTITAIAIGILLENTQEEQAGGIGGYGD